MKPTKKKTTVTKPRRASPETLWRHFLAVDKVLVAAGHPPTSDWWLSQVQRFLFSKRRSWVIRAGRRAGKSSTLMRLQIVVLLYGGHEIPPADVGFALVVSAKMDEARLRLRAAESILEALGVPHDRKDDTIELYEDKACKVSRRLAIRVVAATIASGAGLTVVIAFLDEVCIWKNADGNANPARDVVGNIKPSMATTGGCMIVSSAPWSTVDYHYELFERGDTPEQVVSYAPSWVGNPTLTEAGTRELEPDDRLWRRFYLAVPVASASAAFEIDIVERCFRAPPASAFRAEKVCVIDPSTTGADSFTAAVGAWALPLKPGVPHRWRNPHIYDPNGIYERAWLADTIPPWAWHPDPCVEKPLWVRIPPREEDVDPDGAVFIVDEIWGTEGRFALSEAGRVFDAVAALAKKHKVTRVYGDQRDALACYAELGRRGLKYEPVTWSNDIKSSAVTVVRRWMLGGKLVLPNHDELRRQLHQYEVKVLPSGVETFAGRGSTHDDFASLCVHFAVAELNGNLPRSPMHRSSVVRGVMPFTGWAGV